MINKGVGHGVREKSESKVDKRIMCIVGNIFEIKTLKQMKLVCLYNNIFTDNICLPVLVKN